MKAICYVRVSTDDQVEMARALRPRTDLPTRAAALGAAVVGTFRDEGVSGGFYSQPARYSSGPA